MYISRIPKFIRNFLKKAHAFCFMNELMFWICKRKNERKNVCQEKNSIENKNLLFIR